MQQRNRRKRGCGNAEAHDHLPYRMTRLSI
jgi:hypothetical protein